MTNRLFFLVFACAACGSDPANPTDEDTALVQESIDSVDTDGTVVDNIEVTLSGTVDPSQGPDAAASASALAAEARLLPSSCIASTVQGNVVTHVLTGCTGPAGRPVSGTVVSTWTQEGTCLHVEHATTDFQIAGTSATGSLAVTICQSGTTETRTRTLTFVGITRRNKPISISGSWNIMLDTTTGCATQSGTATGQIGDRMFDRTDTEFDWCSTRAKRAPLDESATVLALRGGALDWLGGTGPLLVEFLGDSRIRVMLDGETFYGLINTSTGAVVLSCCELSSW